MASQTPNLDLRKPGPEDPVDVVLDIAENMDKIDAAVAALSGGGGGGGGTHFVTVAADGTADALKGIAQHVCDGTADEVEINAACDEANTNDGGVVLLLPGDYYLAAPIITGWTHDLIGCGRESTYIYFDGNGDAGPLVNTAWGPYADNYAIIFRSGGYIGGFFLNQSNNSGTGYRGGISMRGTRGLMEGVYIALAGAPATQPIQNAAVRMEGDYSTVRNSYIEAYDGIAFDWSADRDGQRVESNFAGAAVGVWANGLADNLMVLGNVFEGPNADASDPGNAGYGATPYPDFQAGDTYAYANRAGVAMFAGGGNYSGPLVQGNKINGYKTGIVVTDVEHALVTGNQIYGSLLNGAAAGATGILVGNNAWYNTITGNQIRASSSDSRFAYGIDVQAGAGENLVQGNDIDKWSVVTPAQAFRDLGTRTRKGPVYYSPNGTPFTIAIANDGTVSATAVVQS